MEAENFTSKALFVLALTLSTSCSKRVAAPDLGGLYSKTVQASEYQRNPVIVIPGILGSRLEDTESGRVVWGAFRGDYADPSDPDGLRLIAHPIGYGKPLSELKDDVKSTAALDVLKVSVFGLPVDLSAYMNILAALGAGGYRDDTLGKSGAVQYGSDHFTCFQFHYDWRRDIAESARVLGGFIEKKREELKGKYRAHGISDRIVKFDIVAHSMGGLVARYYLMYGTQELPADGSLPELTWEGAKSVETVVLVATPSAGAVDALDELVNGIQFAPFLPKYEPALLGTMPSIYELLPRGRHATVVNSNNPEERIPDLYDPELWERYGWGLAAPDQDRVLEELLPEVTDPAERRKIALEHQRKNLNRAKQLAAALDRPATLPTGVTLHLIAGDASPTPAVVGVDGASGKLKILAEAPGDGTVLRSSALLDERVGGVWSPRLKTPIPWTHVNFLFADHLGLTKDPAFTDNLLFLLLEKPNTAPQ